MNDEIWLRCPECGEKRLVATLSGDRCLFLQVNARREPVPLIGPSNRVSREDLLALRCTVCSWTGTVEDLVTPDFFHSP
jgi:hypothetical protein